MRRDHEPVSHVRRAAHRFPARPKQNAFANRAILALSSIHLTRIARAGEEERREFRRVPEWKGFRPPLSRREAGRRANETLVPYGKGRGGTGRAGEGPGKGESCAGEQILYVRLVAEGSARGKERHETERFLGLAGTFFFYIGVSLHFSLSLSLFSVPRLIFQSRFPLP